jgi:hypothetical protein
VFVCLEASADESAEGEGDNSAAKESGDDSEIKEEDTTAAAEVTSEQPRGLGRTIN